MFLFDYAKLTAEIETLEEQSAAEDFWNDAAKAQTVMQKINALREKAGLYNHLRTEIDDLFELWELGNEFDDSETEKEVAAKAAALNEEIEQARTAILLSGPYDDNNAILSIHPGAGGTESQDWAEMLLRMYTRWVEKNGYRYETLDFLPGDEAGVKSVTILVKGSKAFGYLKAEKGVHRLVRISPFDAAGRRHTSFASVDVLPEVSDSIDVEINPEDLKIDTYRSGGAGGQHVNKTDSAVRITHLPTGIVVTCQNERSQTSNKQVAMKILQARLIDLELRKKEEELAALRGEQADIGWGSQIRSYVFHPYSMVKDHRTNQETGNVNAVMDGDITPFMAAYLRMKAVNNSLQ